MSNFSPDHRNDKGQVITSRSSLYCTWTDWGVELKPLHEEDRKPYYFLFKCKLGILNILIIFRLKKILHSLQYAYLVYYFNHFVTIAATFKQKLFAFENTYSSFLLIYFLSFKFDVILNKIRDLKHQLNLIITITISFLSITVKRIQEENCF